MEDDEVKRSIHALEIEVASIVIPPPPTPAQTRLKIALGILCSALILGLWAVLLWGLISGSHI